MARSDLVPKSNAHRPADDKSIGYGMSAFEHVVLGRSPYACGLFARRRAARRDAERMICCTLREDLRVEVSKLAREGRFDYLRVESTRLSEPLPGAELRLGRRPLLSPPPASAPGCLAGGPCRRISRR